MNTERKNKKISVIIPIYNALEDLKLLLVLLNANFDFNIGEIFLINDCSDEETTKFLVEFSKENSHYKYVKNDENLGFVKTCNRGMELASGEIVVLLNSDTKVPSGFCERIIKCFESDSQIGIASPVSSCTCSYFIPQPKSMDLEDMNKLLQEKHTCTYPLIPAAEGFCYCIKKEVIEQQGYLDTVWGKGYHEEVDYAYKAITNGWKNVLIDDLYVYHKRQASFGSERRAELIRQNDPLFKERWEGFRENYTKENKLVNPVVAIEKEMFPKGNPARPKIGLKPIERIFSITNSEDKRHKILTVLGLKIKLKKHQKFVFPKGTVIKSANIIDNESINYKNKTATIFAMFSVDGLIADNTIEYLTELRKFSDYIVLVGDCPIFENELLKLSGIVDSYIFERHNEYDFGSYKRGFQHLSKNDILKNVDNIIFCNDSVIYLGTSLEDIFINAKKHKFYGITINNGGYSKKLKLINNAPHIQSYFVSISSNIFSENYFKIFMNSIKHFNNKKKIIYNYEQGLSRIIQENGNSLNTYYPPINVSTYFEPCHYYLNENSNFKGPKYFIKKFLIKNYRKVELDENLELVGGKG